jgi:hypothetical protein
MPDRLAGAGSHNLAMLANGLAQVGFVVSEVFVGTFQASAIRTSLSLKAYVPPVV